MGNRTSTKKKLPTGVTTRRYASGREVIVITFTHKGRTCRETMSIEPTPQNIRYAEQLRASVMLAITKGAFDYAEFFPDSVNAARYGSSEYGRKTIAELCQECLDDAREIKSLELSSLNVRQRYVDLHIKPYLGHLTLPELRTSHIEDWIKTSGLAKASAVTALATLRTVIKRAMADRVIQTNPISFIDWTRVQSKAQRNRRAKDKIDPFRESEIAAILANANDERNAFTVALYTGVRVQELPVLKWANIDWERQTILVDAALGRGDKGRNYPKGTKRDKERFVFLLPPALEAIKRQRAVTETHSEYIFLDPKTGGLYALQTLADRWRSTLRRARVRYRPIKQTRHTFASQALSKGEREAWVADQLGHADLQMLRDHYGKWIPEENGAAYKLRGDWNFEKICTDSARKGQGG